MLDYFSVLRGASESEDFGTTQNENIPRINRVEYAREDNGGYPYAIELPKEGWSSWVESGVSDQYSATHLKYRVTALRLNTLGGEVRSKNTTIRIWKRTA